MKKNKTIATFTLAGGVEAYNSVRHGFAPATRVHADKRREKRSSEKRKLRDWQDA